MMRHSFAVAAAVLTLAGCQAAPSSGDGITVPPVPETVAPPPALAPTVVLDAAEADRLMRVTQVSLQWIGWDRRGSVAMNRAGDTITLNAVHSTVDGTGELRVIGRVAEVGTGYFTLDGQISIIGTPGADRYCKEDRPDWRFAVTQDRPYYRLRTFEWCDGLTDYIDFYHPRVSPGG